MCIIHVRYGARAHGPSTYTNTIDLLLVCRLMVYSRVVHLSPPRKYGARVTCIREDRVKRGTTWNNWSLPKKNARSHEHIGAMGRVSAPARIAVLSLFFFISLVFFFFLSFFSPLFIMSAPSLRTKLLTHI